MIASSFRYVWLMGLAVGLTIIMLNVAAAADDGGKPPQVNWSFSGFFGTFDKGQLQRGYQIYREVCSSCHSMNLMSFRNLSQEGGPEFTSAALKALAADTTITDDTVSDGERPGIPTDYFPNPYVSELEGREANGGSLPPDLSVIVKARSVERGFFQSFFDIIGLYQEGGADYVHGLLTGFQDPPPTGWEVPEDKYFNKYFSGYNIAMAPPLSDDLVDYSDGTAQSVDQYAKDVTAFLAWSAEPSLVERKRLGLQVLIFMIIFAVLLYASKRRLWSKTH